MMSARIIALSTLLTLIGAGLTGCNDGRGNQQQLPALPTSTDLTLQPVTAGFNSPVFMATHSSDPRLFVVEQRGQIRIVDNTTGAVLPTPFLDIRTQVLFSGEQGLLGMAFDPSYGTNGRIYAFYTNLNGDLVIARFLRLNSSQADPTPDAILQTIPHPSNSNHNGGMLTFGPDDCLYAAVGDGGGSGDPNSNGQSLTTKLGKLLRLDPNSGEACTIGGINPSAILGDSRSIG